MTVATAIEQDSETIELPPGPIANLIPQGSLSTRERESLRGHASSGRWLPPAGEIPEIDEFLIVFGRLRREIVTVAFGLREAEDQWRREDAALEDAKVKAARSGDAEPTASVTPQEARDAARQEAQDRLVVLGRALAGLVEEIVAVLRDVQIELVTRERNAHQTAERRRREAQRIIAETNRDAWRAAERSRWIKQTVASDGAFDRQEFPTPSAAPDRVTRHVIEKALALPNQKPVA